MIKKYFSFAILILILVVSYKKFQQYSPKIVKNVQEVQGISTKKEVIPYPKDSEIIANLSTESSEQITLKTSMDYKKIKEFYRNILLESDWRIKSEEKNDTFNTLKFKKDKTTIKIISTIAQEDNKTLLSIYVSKE